MREVFEEIAEEEGGKFLFDEEKLPNSSWGASTPEGHNKLSIEYKGFEIRLVFTTMTHSVAQIEVNLPSQQNDMEFEISTRSRFMSLFSPKRNRITIKTGNLGLQQSLENDFGLEQIQLMTKDYAFEPFIKGKNTLDGYLVRTEFHLQFPERVEVVRPLIFFYKSLIDRFVV